MKKAPEIARLAEAQKKINNTETYYTHSVKMIEKQKIVTIIGLLLIKKIHQLKIFFQENKRFFIDWKKQLKIKKAQKEKLAERKELEQLENLENKEGDTLIDVHNEEYLNKLIEENSELQKKEVTKQAKIIRKREIRKAIKPIVSKRVVTPKKIRERKDIFEKILIDRIAVNPKDIEAYERLGEYYSEIENWEYAKECFKQVIRLDNKNISVKIKMKRLERLLSK